jgi:hypothetical protein
VSLSLRIGSQARTAVATIPRRLKTDKAVIKAFTEKRAEMSKKLTSDGKMLDGNWMGGKGIAGWCEGKIHFKDLGSKAAQKYQRAVIREAPILDIAEGSTWAGGGAFMKRWAAAEARRLERKGSAHKRGKNPHTRGDFALIREERWEDGEQVFGSVLKSSDRWEGLWVERGPGRYVVRVEWTDGIKARGYPLEGQGGPPIESPFERHKRGDNPRTTAQGAKCGVRVGTLDAAKEARIPSKLFGLPKLRKYPMPDASHAANAKARAKQALDDGHLTRAQYHQVVRKADRILLECGGVGPRKPKRKKQKKRGAKRKARATLAKSETTADIRLKTRMRGLIGRA